MKVSYRWLQDYVTTSLNPEQLGDKFRLTSSEIEGMEDWGSRFQGLVVGKVLSVAKHPNADKLRLAEVEVGEGKPRHIVCGAPNLAEGLTVIVALPGTLLHPLKGDPFTISATVIRGEPSEGMLCAADEIGLPLASEGIMELPPELKPGTSAASALCLDDTVLDLEVTPNRPDLLSHIGLAREVAAFDKGRLSEPSLAVELAKGITTKISLDIEDSHLCLRATAVGLKLDGTAQSPLWMQSRLLLCGIRPISAIVDITNYVMLEYGQPLHAFDIRSITGGGIKVRSAHPGEKIRILDGTERQLETNDIVVTDAKGTVLDIAGIMGGEESGIADDTKEILLFSANFHGPQVRRTSRRLGLRSEASGRFEKGLDPELTITALKRAAYLFQEICEAKASTEICDRYPGKEKAERPRIHLSFSEIQEITGVHISAPEAKGILQRLGFQISSLTKSSFDTTPPSWRRDVSLPEDVVEELIRIWGFERLPSTMPTGAVKAPAANLFFSKKSLIRRVLAGLGMHECVHLSFASRSDLTRLGLPTEQAVPLQNPLSSQTEYLASTHAIPLLGNLGSSNLQESEICLFEIGHVFALPQIEREMLSAVLRSNQDIEQTYRFAKAAINRIAFQLDLPEPTYAESNGMPFMEAGAATRIVVGETEVGVMGPVSQETVSRLKIRSGRNIMYFEINLDKLLVIPPRKSLYLPPSAYPNIERDLTVILDQNQPVGKLLELIDRQADRAILRSWNITDIFTGKPLPEGKKSVTVHFTYGAETRTLEDREASADQDRIAQELSTQLSATRS